MACTRPVDPLVGLIHFVVDARAALRPYLAMDRPTIVFIVVVMSFVATNSNGARSTILMVSVAIFDLETMMHDDKTYSKSTWSKATKGNVVVQAQSYA